MTGPPRPLPGPQIRGTLTRMSGHPREAPGPFRADQIRDGDPYELSDGHAIRCMTAGERHARANLEGGRVLATDPAVDGAVGVDAGFSFNDSRNLRAPDLSVGVGTSSTWMRTAPPLAVEYADTGQDEPELARKIDEMLAAGTRIFWVVRLTGPVRVEVHTRDEPVRVVDIDGTLTAPGILQNPVPVRALVDARAANAATLRNLLNAAGYDSIEAIRSEGKREGRQEGMQEGEHQAQLRAIVTILRTRGLHLGDAHHARLQACRDPLQLTRWLSQSVTAASTDAALD